MVLVGDFLSWQPMPKAEDRRVIINTHAKETPVQTVTVRTGAFLYYIGNQ